MLSIMLIISGIIGILLSIQTIIYAGSAKDRYLVLIFSLINTFLYISVTLFKANLGKFVIGVYIFALIISIFIVYLLIKGIFKK